MIKRQMYGERIESGRRLALALLGTTILAGVPTGLAAQDGPAADAQPAPPAAIAPTPPKVQSITVVGAQRLEPRTIISYIQMRQGDSYTQAAADQALKDLYATELFSDATVRFENGNVIIEVTENPVINRIILEGNKRLKSDKIYPEIKLSPRQIFTRSKVRADTARIIELYKRQGRFAATVEPKTVQLSQNRVDVVYEIVEGPKSKVRQINIIGNEVYSDGKLRGEMVTKQNRLTTFFSSNTSYDPDRLAFDQQNLRQFYLSQGYADFRVVSAVAELTPDKEDFIITYVVEEGERYKFGEVDVDSQIRDFNDESLASNLPMKTGDWFDAKLIEDTVEQLSELAGTYGYAFADVQPQFRPNKDDLTMNLTFILNEAPRVYVERVDVNGNTLTQDKVLRREFRISEGDAFNSLGVARTSNRIKSLGYFQENFEVEQKDGSAPDRIILEANVEEQSLGELQLSAGFSSIENFILSASIRQRNFRGRGQTIGAGVNWSRYSRSVNVSFAEPYLFNRNIFAGVDLYRREIDSFNYVNNSRNTTFAQSTTGGSIRLGAPLSEYMNFIASYTLNFDDISLSDQFFSDRDGDGISTCDPILAGRFLCDAIGKRTSSILGGTLSFSNLNSNYRPTRGMNVSMTGQFAGLGGSVKYLRATAKTARYWEVMDGFIFSLTAEGGVIHGLGNRDGEGVDDIRLNDRFFLGEGQMRGFDLRGVGPRVVRLPYLTDTDGNQTLLTLEEARVNNNLSDDAIGGKAYYLGRAELEIPLGSGASELGLRPSIFLDVGALFDITRPSLQDFPNGVQAVNASGELIFIQPIFDDMGAATFDDDGNALTEFVTNAVAPDGSDNAIAVNPGIQPFREVFLGNSSSPRISLGIGVNWNSPFGPFRIDFAHVLKSQEGDDEKRFSFNVGTQF